MKTTLAAGLIMAILNDNFGSEFTEDELLQITGRVRYNSADGIEGDNLRDALDVLAHARLIMVIEQGDYMAFKSVKVRYR